MPEIDNLSRMLDLGEFVFQKCFGRAAVRLKQFPGLRKRMRRRSADAVPNMYINYKYIYLCIYLVFISDSFVLPGDRPR